MTLSEEENQTATTQSGGGWKKNKKKVKIIWMNKLFIQTERIVSNWIISNATAIFSLGEKRDKMANE